MPRDKHQKKPRGDPLAGWKKENLAAPKHQIQQVQDFPQSVYDDVGPVPAPVAKHVTEPRKSILKRTPPEQQAKVQEPLGGGQSEDLGEPKRLKDDEKGMCPDGDTRWPPPKSSHSKPLHLLLDEKGSKCIYYHLIFKNSAPEAKTWKQEIKSKAHFYRKQKVPPAPPINEAGKSAQQLQQEKEQLGIDNKGKARSAIITAKMQRKLREISYGPRGTIWLLEEENIDVWRCIEIVQKASPPHNAVNLGATTEKFEVFGVGLKGEKDHVLLVSQKVTVI